MRTKVKILDFIIFNRGQLIDVIKIYLNDRYHGIESLKQVPVKSLGISAEKMPVWYESSANSHLVKVFKNLNVCSGDSIIDFGCGKCGALLFLRKFPFRRFIGIEYSKQLYDQGHYNIERIGDRRFKIIYEDAGEYSDLNQINFIYMFNPFGIATMSKVLQNINRSFEQKPRKITLVYLNPVLHDDILASGIFTKISEHKSGFKYKFNVYETPDSVSN